MPTLPPQIPMLQHASAVSTPTNGPSAPAAGPATRHQALIAARAQLDRLLAAGKISPAQYNKAVGTLKAREKSMALAQALSNPRPEA